MDGRYGQLYWRIAGEVRRLNWSTAQECDHTDEIRAQLRAADENVWALAKLPQQ